MFTKVIKCMRISAKSPGIRPWLIIGFLLLLLQPISALAQLSDLHYLPPLKQESNNIGFQAQKIYLSTPETTEFDVKVYQGTNTTPIKTFELSNTNPYIYSLGNGDNNVTFVNDTNTGVVLSNSGLRFESENGERFYVNHRGAQGAQGSSLTSKGRAALGKRFRWGGGPVIYGDDTNATLGIMATEDGTTVEISGYDPSIVFRKGSDVDAITDDRLSITLNKGQSYVLEYAIRNLPNFNSNKTYDEWMGALIAADKDIAVSLGNALYSPSNDSSRDIAIDQIIPENVLGNEYVFARGYGSDALEFAVIIATQNGTEIYVNDDLTPLATIDSGEYYIVPGSYYSGSSVVRSGENMYVRASKQVYAYHSTAGANAGANVDYNFIAPVNFLLDKEVNFIPSVNKLASTTITGGVSIISAASTPDAEVEVYENGVLQDLTGKRKVVSGSELWVTYFLDGLSGDVKVLSTNSIAVGFMGQSGDVGASGYFSGFETIPSIDVDVKVVGECLQDGQDGQDGNVSLAAPDGYAIYQWYKEGEPVSGGTQRTLTPSLPGSYTVGVTQSEDGKEFVSAPVDVSDCLPEVVIDVTSTQQSLTEGQTTTLRINYKYQSFFDAEDAEVSVTIPEKFSVTASDPSVGQWSDETETWTLGTVSPGDEQVLELTLEALAIGDPVTVTASNTQTVKGSDNNILTEGDTITDDLSESFTIKNETVINAATSITKTVLDADFNLGATSNNPNPITYLSSDLGVVRVLSDGTTEIRSAGTAIITMTQGASELYGPAEEEVTITVSRVEPVLSNFSDINKVFGEPSFQITAPTTTSNGYFSYASSDTSVATIDSSSGLITIKKAGTTTITADQESTGNFDSASIDAVLTVAKADQQILVGPLPDEKTILQQLVGPDGEDTPIPISATSTSGDDVTISLPDSSIGSLSGSIGSYQLDSVSSSGELIIDFDVPSSDNYNGATRSITLDVEKIPQTITFDPAMPSSEVYSESLVIPITADAPSSSPMAFNVISGPATVTNNGKLNITGTGVITYSVDNPGDSIFSKAPQVVETLSVSKGTTELSNFDIEDKAFGDPDFTLPVPSSNRGGDFTYVSNRPDIASVSDGVVSINNPETVKITATQEVSDNWTRESISTNFEVAKGTPEITGLSTLSKRTIDPDFVYSVVSSAPSLPIEFRTSDPSVATVDSTTGLVSIQGIGTVEIRASQAATDTYHAATKVLTLTVTKADPVIEPLPDLEIVLGEEDVPVPAPASDSGGAFSFSSSDPNVVEVDGASGAVTSVDIGETTVAISQAATARYNPTSSTRIVRVVPQNSPPTGLSLSATSVMENAALGTVVGSLSATDPDAGDTLTYTLVSGAGDTDNASFAISGAELTTAEVFDFEAKDSLSVRIRVSDSGGLTFERAFEITVTDQNEPPTGLSLSATSVMENAALGTVVGTLSATDPDAGDTFTYTLVSGAGDTDNASFAISGAELTTAEVFDFEAKDSLSVRIRVSDSGGLTFERAFEITVIDLNGIGIQVDGGAPGAFELDPSALPRLVSGPSLSGLNLSYGSIAFDLQGGAPGSTATVTLTYPAALPDGTRYWKFNPSTDKWFVMPADLAVVDGTTITLTLVDGGVGDLTGEANGRILDPGGPGVLANNFTQSSGETLMLDVVDELGSDGLDPESLAAVNAAIDTLLDIAQGGDAGLTVENLNALGFTEVVEADLAAITAAVAETPADGSGVASLALLAQLINAATADDAAVAAVPVPVPVPVLSLGSWGLIMLIILMMAWVRRVRFFDRVI